jgi:hypothetical protein
LLILLSSGARRRYRDDIVRALAHPEGTHLRFRYGEEYVEPSALADAKKDALKGRTALICHLADQPDGKSALLVPCRFATIARTQLIGTSLVISLEVGAYVQRLDDPALRALMTPEERALLPNQGSDAQTPPGRFAFEIAAPLNANTTPKAAEMSAFEQTTKALRAAGFGSAEPPMAFYAIRDLVEASGKGDGSDPVITPVDGRYVLQSGKRYMLDVYSYAPDGDKNPSEASTLTIEADESDVKFSSETAAKLDSRYDLNRFRFSVEQRIATLPTGLRVALGVPAQVDGKTVQEERCDVTLEVRFASSNLLAAGRVAAIAAGTAGPAIIAAIVRPEWSLGLGAVMLVPALFAAWVTVYPNFKKS